MAGDWIKVECTTPDKPEVIAMAEILGIDQDAVFGKLMRIWIWADSQTVDGNAGGNGVSVTVSFLDRCAHVTGFGKALEQVGWLIRGPDGRLTFPNFVRHNGSTAKARACTARRVANHKKSNAKGNAEANAASVSEPLANALPRVREEKNNTKKPPTPLQGDAPRSSEKQSTNVDATAKAQAKRKGPAECVTREVLRDTAKLVRWWRYAANCGLVDGTENSRLNVVGVACQVLGSEAVRDPVAVFVATVRDKAWDRIGEAADEQARRRLKDFDAGKRARNASPEIAAALGRLANAKASRATDDDLAAYGDGGGDE